MHFVFMLFVVLCILRYVMNNNAFNAIFNDNFGIKTYAVLWNNIKNKHSQCFVKLKPTSELHLREHGLCPNILQSYQWNWSLFCRPWQFPIMLKMTVKWV